MGLSAIGYTCSCTRIQSILICRVCILSVCVDFLWTLNDRRCECDAYMILFLLVIIIYKGCKIGFWQWGGGHMSSEVLLSGSYAPALEELTPAPISHHVRDHPASTLIRGHQLQSWLPWLLHVVSAACRTKQTLDMESGYSWIDTRINSLFIFHAECGFGAQNKTLSWISKQTRCIRNEILFWTSEIAISLWVKVKCRAALDHTLYIQISCPLPEDTLAVDEMTHYYKLPRVSAIFTQVRSPAITGVAGRLGWRWKHRRESK